MRTATPPLGSESSARFHEVSLVVLALSLLRAGHETRETVRRGVNHVPTGEPTAMAAYTVNHSALERARRLIDARQYVLDSDWGESQPNADAENEFLRTHTWHEYGDWHLGLTEGANDETKARYAFVYGDFRRVHRSGLIACVYRASEWRHKAVELAAHGLLQRLDDVAG